MWSKKGTPKAAVNVISVFIYFACLELVCMLLLKIQVAWAVTLRYVKLCQLVNCEQCYEK